MGRHQAEAPKVSEWIRRQNDVEQQTVTDSYVTSLLKSGSMVSKGARLAAIAALWTAAVSLTRSICSSSTSIDSWTRRGQIAMFSPMGIPDYKIRKWFADARINLLCKAATRPRNP
jgi:hypothetical protein